MNFPEIGDKFTHKASGLIFFIVACDPNCHSIVLQKEGKREVVTLSTNAFFDLFTKFGEYKEKDLVPCL